MSTVPTRLLTPQEYLDRERAAEFRSEFYRSEMFAMERSCWSHSLIKSNFSAEAWNQFEGGPCKALTSSLRVHIAATGLFTYPDILIICEEPQFYDSHQDTLLNPRIIVEVFSETSERYDRGAKFRNYRQLPTVEEYVFVAQNEPLVERFVRLANGSWALTTADDLAQIFSFGSMPVQIPLAKIYHGVKFAEESGR